VPEQACCAACGDELPDDFPRATTCREWADAYARRLGGLLSEELYQSLLLVRGLCQLVAALQDGRNTIGEP
jgi:hypothetical protein